MLVRPVSFSQSPTSFEQLSRRIHRQVNSSLAQADRWTVIMRLPDERIDDWDALLEKFEVEESVRVTRLGEGTVSLRWTNQHLN